MKSAAVPKTKRTSTKGPVVLNQSIYYKYNADKDIFSIYLYYITYSKNGAQNVSAHFHLNPVNPIDSGTELKQLITFMANDIAAGESGWPAYASSFDEVPHRRKSYFVIVVDDDERRLKKKKDGGALTFYNYAGADANHTFFNGKDLEIKLSGKRTASAIVCVNHMLSEVSGSDLGMGKQESFRFRMNFQGERTRPDDSGGTNQGQPLPPPYRRRRGPKQSAG
ncbi:MAG TPA: hypothetical protein VF782_15845 [Allosphingosinicella sp.]|jgi:hypothetical protein